MRPFAVAMTVAVRGMGRTTVRGSEESRSLSERQHSDLTLIGR